MFGEHAGHPQLLGHLVHQLDGGQALLRGHAGGGLVQQQQLGLAGQGNGQLQAFLVAMGQGAGGSRSLRGQAHPLKQLQRARHMLAASRRPDIPGLPGMGGQGHLHVFQHRHAMEHPGDLEGAAHAQAGQPVRRQARDLAAVKVNLAFVGLEQARQGVEKRAFTGPIGANDGVKFTGLDLHVHALQGLQAAKSFGDAAHLQHKGAGGGAHRSVLLKRPTRPVGMSSTSNTMMMPMASGQYSVLPLIMTSSTT